MTLIEVLVALMLLGSLAVAMLLSRGRLMDQHARAQQKLEAVQAADRLLASWWAGDLAAFPLNQEGDVDGYDDWRWQTKVMQDRQLEPYSAQIVRLEIVDTAMPGEPVELTSVDLIIPQGGTP